MSMVTRRTFRRAIGSRVTEEASLRIGNVEIEKPLALAPMEDVSDYRFRMICKGYGADLLYTEFAN